MQSNTDIQNKIDAALNSIDNLQRATPQPFFYTRLMAKIADQKQSAWERLGSFISRPAIAFISLSLIILLNLFAAYSHLNTSSPTDQQELTTTEEYTQVATNFDDFENIKP
jgi:uncharacterized membrane protein YdfJ with MMPL/SSD domain